MIGIQPSTGNIVALNGSQANASIRAELVVQKRIRNLGAVLIGEQETAMAIASREYEDP